MAQLSATERSDTQGAKTWLVIHAISLIVVYGGFTLAHWIFGYRYFTISRVMKFVVSENPQPVPEDLSKNAESVNIAGIVINSLISVLAGGFFVLVAMVDAESVALDACYEYSTVAVGVLQVISACLLGIGICKIHSLAKEHNMRHRINNNQFLLHYSAFGLYLLATAVMFISYTLYFVNGKTNPYPVMNTVSISNLISFIAQSLILAILLPLTSKKPYKKVEGAASVNARKRSAKETYSEDDDVN